MIKYLQLQGKRLLRCFPGTLLVALILAGSLGLAFQMFVQQSSTQEENKKFPIAICGDTSNSFLQMGLSTLTTFDSTRFALEILEMEETEASRALAMGEISAYVEIPDGFMEAAFSGEILPIKFYTTTGAGGIVSLVKEELSSTIYEYLLSSQKGVYGMWDTLQDNGLQHKAGGQMDRLSLIYMDYIFVRDRMYSMEELGVSDHLGLEGYLLCGLSVLLVLLICLPFASQIIPGDPALGRLLKAKGKSVWTQAACDFIAYAGVFLLLSLILTVAAMVYMDNTIPLLGGVVPVALLAVAFSFMIFSLSRDIISGVLLYFFVLIILCFISGCLYPVYFFPVPMQQIAQWLPTGLARMHLAGCIAGKATALTLPVLLCYCGVFIAVGAWARVRHVQEVAY